MQEFKIFTEGKSDIKFIQDYISGQFGINLSGDAHFDVLGSWSGYKKEGLLKTSVRLNHDNNKQTILILDADNDFPGRLAEVKRDFQSYNIPVHLFLFPNNSGQGCLEDMLYEIAVDRNIFHCFSTYEECIAGYHLPTIKDKIFAYLDALLSPQDKSLIQPANRNYRNAAHWNLHHEYLTPLHTFLRQFFP